MALGPDTTRPELGGTDPWLGQPRTAGLPAVRLRDVLLGSSFRLNLGATDPAGSVLSLTAWGRVAGTQFDGRDELLTIDGDVLTGTAGVDGTWDRWLAGVAMSHSRGAGSFTLADPGADGRGEVAQTLTSIHPYLRYAVTDRLDVWGLLGYGWGELALKPTDGLSLETDTEFLMGSIGSRGILLPATETGGFELATRTDAMFTRMTSDAVSAPADRGGNLAGAAGAAHRVRLVLEGTREVTWPEGQRVTPAVEIGLRHDWGDAETGFGLELGGRVQYADPGHGLTIEAAVRGLLAHEDNDYEEWGASGTIRIDPGPMGQGLALTLSPAWGAASSGVDGLWSRQTTAGLAPQDRQRQQGGQVNLQVGYGVWLPALGGTLTPGAGLQMTNSGQSQSRASLVFDGLHTQAGALRMTLEGGRTANPGGPPAYNIGLQLQLQFGHAGTATPAPTARSESHTARPAEQRAEAGDRYYFVQLGAFRHPGDAARARHDLAGDLAGLLERPDMPRLAVLGSPQGGHTRLLFAHPYPTRTAAAALCANVTAYGTTCEIVSARHHPAPNAP